MKTYNQFAEAYGHQDTGRTLVVGSKVYGEKSDRRDMYKNAVGLDMLPGKGVDIVHDLEYPLDIDPFDHIDICSVLEHVKRPWLLCQNIDALMKIGSTITLSVPFVWREHGYPNDYWRMTKSAIKVLFPNIKWSGLEYFSENILVDAPPSKVISGCRFFKKTVLQGLGTKENAKT